MSEDWFTTELQNLTKKQSGNLHTVAVMMILGNSNILLHIRYPKYHCETSLNPQINNLKL